MRWIGVSVLVLLISMGCLLSRPQSETRAAQNRETGLPGAAAVIDASRFPTLQAAVDAVPLSGGMLQLPPGTFEIDEPLVIPGENLLITGAGPATRIVNRNANGLPTMRLVPAGEFDRSATGNKRQFRWRVQIANLHLKGNPASGAGIEALWVNEIQIENVSITEHGGDGILLDHCYEDPRIHDCLLTYNKACGIKLLGCHDIVVSANHFEENQDALQCLDSFNLCMTGNNLDDHLGHGVVIENTYGSVVSGNMIEECNGTAIILDRDCYGDTISANVIAHNAAGVDLRDAHGCAVSANTFTIMKSAALRIRSGSDRITVTGNSFSNSYLGDGQVRRELNDQSAGGLWLESTGDITITGNVFSGLTEPAIRLGGQTSKRIIVVGNVLQDVDSEHSRLNESIDELNLPPSTDDRQATEKRD